VAGTFAIKVLNQIGCSMLAAIMTLLQRLSAVTKVFYDNIQLSGHSKKIG
jgi:hypothetical protein